MKIAINLLKQQIEQQRCQLRNDRQWLARKINQAKELNQSIDALSKNLAVQARALTEAEGELRILEGFSKRR